MNTLNDTAASDLIGVMALIAIFVTATAIAGVALLSYPPGDAAPAMIARMESVGENVYIYHDGGDPLERGHFAILVDGVDRTAGAILVDASGSPSSNWTSWGTGQALIISTDVPVSGDVNLQIVGEGVGRTGSDWLLHEIGSGPAVEPTTIPTTEPTQVPLVASFSADRTSGSAPLEVQFIDNSAGGATSWTWNFGDGGTSTARNPVHTYTATGTYTVSLTVTRTGASDTEVKTDYITVTPPPTRYDTLLNTPDEKSGDLMPGGYLEFRVLKPGIWVDAYVVTTNARYDLVNGDTVKLVIGTKGKGEIYINGPMLSTFDYDDVTLYVNGEQIGTGDIVSIYFLQENLSSTLTLNVPSSNLWTEFKIDDTVLIRGEDSREITLYNLMPRKDGLMNLNNRPYQIWFQGSITGYTLG